MTRDEIRKIEHMWKIASNDPHHDFNWYDPAVVKFAELVRADEREACAKICDDWPNGRDDVYSIGVAIRARSNT